MNLQETIKPQYRTLTPLHGLRFIQSGLDFSEVVHLWKWISFVRKKGKNNTISYQQNEREHLQF